MRRHKCGNLISILSFTLICHNRVMQKIDPPSDIPLANILPSEPILLMGSVILLSSSSLLTGSGRSKDNGSNELPTHQIAPVGRNQGDD